MQATGPRKLRDNHAACSPPSAFLAPNAMWIVAIAWMYIVTLMALAEGTNPQGTWLGATITFLLYGLAPLSLVMYLMGAPARRRAILAAERAQAQASTSEASTGDGAPEASGSSDAPASNSPPVQP